MCYILCDIHYVPHRDRGGVRKPAPRAAPRLPHRRRAGRAESEQYGYTLRKALADHGLAIDEGTLYPLLRRLESQGLLVSEWREEDKRTKRFYRLSPQGRQILKQLLGEWTRINASLSRIL